ncbi:hypothetical protein ABLB69_19975 [Xenorhabdus khoisanae]|uniref:hypothetical protein n=1 Tax=Xenorhabdus khoisanae TaxID=880157 RepID=UPI0032B6FF98
MKKIENGRQLGKSFSFSRQGELYWSSVGLQKVNGKYKVYVDEILESKMIAEEFLREECLVFDTLDEAISYINCNTETNISELAPCKGQKVFNPDFY